MKKTQQKTQMDHRMSDVVPDWPKVAGAQLSRVLTPLCVVGDALVLRASTWEWRTEAQKLADQIIPRVNATRPHDRQLSALYVLRPGQTVHPSSRHRPSGRAS